MANDLYKKGMENLIKGNIDLDTDTMKWVAVKVTAGYSVNIATDDALDDISAGNRIATSGALTGVTVTDGVLDATDLAPAFTSVGVNIEALVLYKDSGAEATSYLLAYIDTATGLPLTQDGGNVNLTFDSGANKIINFDS